MSGSCSGHEKEPRAEPQGIKPSLICYLGLDHQPLEGMACSSHRHVPHTQSRPARKKECTNVQSDFTGQM